MSSKIETKKCKNLTKREMDIMNKARVKEFGKGEKKNFKKDYPLTSDFFFVKEKEKIVAFTIVIPVKLEYLNKNYNILGLCSFISIKKRKGYARKLTGSIIEYVKKKEKSALGFTGKTIIFGKIGLKTKKGFIKRFRYRNPRTKEIEIDNDGDGIYINGKDNFIKKVLSTKSLVYSDIPFW